MRFCSLLALLALLATPCVAQSDRWQITLDDERILWDLRFLRLEGESLFVRHADTTTAVPVSRMYEVRLVKPSVMAINDARGIGALSALLGADDEVYDFRPLEFADRLRAVQKILVYHPIDGSP